MTLKLLLSGKETADFKSIKNAFLNSDTNVISATSMALALFLARKNLPDIVISQEHLTDSDGLSLYYELKNEKELEKIPFILLLPKEQAKTNLPIKGIYLFIANSLEAPESIIHLKEKILEIINDSC